MKTLLKFGLFYIITVCTITCREEVFQSNCLDLSERSKHTRFASRGHDPITFQISKRITHQLTTRIFAIFLSEVQGYNNIKIENIVRQENTFDRDKLYHIFEPLVSFGYTWPKPNVDLEVWSLTDYHAIPPEVEEGGPVTSPGRFGIFTPKKLIADSNLLEFFHYTKFSSSSRSKFSAAELKTYSINDQVLQQILPKAEKIKCGGCQNNIFTPEHCRTNTCAYLLAADFYETSFVMLHINETKLNFKVIWLGNKLKLMSRYLLELYTTDVGHKRSGSKFLIFSWTPSDVIDSTIEYLPIVMPRCEEMQTSNQTGCKYELTPLLKYYSQDVKHAEVFHESLVKLHFSNQDIRNAIQIYEQYESSIPEDIDSVEIDQVPNQDNVTVKLLKDNSEQEPSERDRVLNQVACEWMRNNSAVYSRWLHSTDRAGKEDIYIGGIFPVTSSTKMYKTIVPAAFAAQAAVNSNPNILNNHNLYVINQDGQCRPDIVMRTFINYYLKQDKIIGVLGPACSETVEPIAGVSKHFRMTVISYSAEGASFADREAYPYFFRTIGENRQYEHVYVQLLNRLKWGRVAALTEDGQKYTEYIAHMESMLRTNGIEMISNKKFPRDQKSDGMRKFLSDLKANKAKIIIADINDDVAKMILCEAYNLKMTAKYGYVWFLPVWLSKNWNTTQSSSSRSSKDTSSCTLQQIMEAIDGHFSLAHAPFGDRDAIMQENITIGAWLDDYTKTYYNGVTPTSDYGAYAYDGVWVYAKALDELIKDGSTYLSDLHSPKTTNRLIEIIKKIDFQGVSGRVRFSESGSRFTDVNILQWVNGTSKIVGSFQPNISANQVLLAGGTLKLNESAIVWLSADGKPNDGTYICTLEGLARLFNTDCENAGFILTLFLCLFIIIAISTASFIFWKRKYDQKLLASTQLLKNLGINLFDTTVPGNTLDKWEVPKDQVVINRRLGDGAFGTVYGGEARINDNGWTAVAVKTLKTGSTTEDRLDFLAEAEAMKRFDHQNIVKLLGVCLQSEPVYTIMEYMLYGDLKTFLLARRHLVSSQKVTDDSDISPKRLTMMAMDMARALSYLTEMKYVHRDVACRNCMVNAQRVVKLGDFGMARPTFENDYYRFNRKGLLPVRWMAPESLNLGLFTPASDVWSFGVLLYEIITFGSFPFQGMTNNQVLEHVKNGNTLDIPTGVKPQLEGLIKACWNHQYKKRPSASEVLEYISNSPRLLSPCLDVPLASVQMPESDSDPMELLPGIRKRSVTPITTNQGLNGLTKSINLNNFDINSANNLPTNATYLNSLNIPSHETIAEDLSARTTSSGYSSNTYNPIEPLLVQRKSNPEIAKSNSSLLRYVPMCGFGKNKTPSIDSECRGVNTSAL